MTTKSDYKEDISNASAHFKTNHGEFKVELFLERTPETCWNFINLAEGRQEGTPKEGPYYDGLVLHRIIENFMIQGGCPLGEGYGGPGYQFKDEFDPELKHDAPGVLSMANAGPGTNGSQFFITLVPTPHLDGGHTVFGKVIEGLDTVLTIGKVPTGPGDKPASPVVIESVKILRS